MKPKINMIFMLAVLFLLGIILFGCQNNTDNSKNDQVVGNDRDSHGCIGSAGYSWCEEKQKCIRKWEEPCGIPNNCTEEQKQNTMCTTEYIGVCASDGKTYPTGCVACAAKADYWTMGEC